MKIVKSPRIMQHLAEAWRRRGKTIGLVPTMGALHKGHLSLIKRSAKENDLTVVSIFVNPKQFGPNEDFDRYPRDFKGDCKLAASSGADVIFAPLNEAIYPDGFATSVDPGPIGQILEGAARPGHFVGVATICVKLFNIVKPHRAYFGRKDAQQLAVIMRVVNDLNLDLKIIPYHIVRSESGVALSSRHAYLEQSDLQKAESIYTALREARRSIGSGNRDIESIKELIRSRIESHPPLTVEYIAVNSWPDLSPLEKIEGDVLISLVARIKGIRLLDNILIKVPRR